MKRNKHNLSHTKLLSCDMGELVPISCVEVLPGDSVMHATSLLVRAQPLLAPVMHPVDVRIHHWYVPLRLIWDDFEDFITGGPAGTSVPVPPRFSPTFTVGQLGDYLGYPLGTAGLSMSILPFRAYQTIWNEWYRDQDLQTAAPVSTASGTDATTVGTLQRCSWEKDYFTSARPWEQKGTTVTIPLGTSAPITRVSNAPAWIGYGAGTDVTGNSVGVGLAAADGALSHAGAGAIDYSLDPAGGLITDLTGASAITVNALRAYLAAQRYKEARARYGSRYTEYLRYLGVTSSDARLQRPEYLGGGRQTIQFSEVLQTAVPAAGSTVVGQMRGHGIAAMRSNRYKRFFEEHGYIMTLMSVRPKTMYSQGLPRKFNRTSKELYWQKELEHIGQQAIPNTEIYATHASPTGTFGYQDRYDEYRREVSTVAGEFRNSTLNFWHLARDFSSDPALNSTFVSCVPTERVFPVPSEDVLYVHARHNMVARRLVAPVGTSFTF